MATSRPPAPSPLPARRVPPDGTRPVSRRARPDASAPRVYPLGRTWAEVDARAREVRKNVFWRIREHRIPRARWGWRVPEAKDGWNGRWPAATDDALARMRAEAWFWSMAGVHKVESRYSPPPGRSPPDHLPPLEISDGGRDGLWEGDCAARAMALVLREDYGRCRRLLLRLTQQTTDRMVISGTEMSALAVAMRMRGWRKIDKDDYGDGHLSYVLRRWPDCIVLLKITGGPADQSNHCAAAIGGVLFDMFDSRVEWYRTICTIGPDPDPIEERVIMAFVPGRPHQPSLPLPPAGRGRIRHLWVKAPPLPPPAPRRCRPPASARG